MKNIKKLLLALFIFGLGYSILDAIFTDGIKNTYCLSDDKCVTVWKRGNGEAYIIFGKHKGQKIPTDNYVKLINAYSSTYWFVHIIFTEDNKLIVSTINDKKILK